MSEPTKNFRLLTVHGSTIKMTALNCIWGSTTHFPGIRIQMSKKDEDGFFPGPEVPLDHLSAFIGHLEDLRTILENNQVSMKKNAAE